MSGFAEALRQALRLLRAHRLRSALTLFGLVWGSASVIFLVSWGTGVNEMLERAFQRTGKNLAMVWPGRVSEEFTPAVDRRQLWYTMEDVEALRDRARLPDLIAGEARTYVAATYRQRARSLEARGVEPEGVQIRSVSVAAGRNISHSDVDHRRRVLVLGHEARRDLLGAEGGIGSWVRIDGTPFQVIGVLARVGTQLSRDGEEIDDQIWLPLSTHLVKWPNPFVDEDVLNVILLRLRDRKLIEETRHEVRAILAERLGVSATDEEAIPIWSPVEMLGRIPSEQQRALLVMIASTTLLISGIGILTLMLDAVRERRPEIGVRLAVGATPRDVGLQFFLETLCIVTLGGALGVGLGVAGCLALGSVDAPDLLPVPVLEMRTVVASLVVLGIVGVGAGWFPAWRAAGVDPAETLRAE
jgi:putative ABC transport system permease protein